MQEYYDKDIKKAISSLCVKQGVSKEGSKYDYLELSFNNGYSKRIFINAESTFAVKNAIELLTTESVIDKKLHLDEF